MLRFRVDDVSNGDHEVYIADTSNIDQNHSHIRTDSGDKAL